MKAASVTKSRPDTSWRPLMAAVVAQAVRDAKEGNFAAQVDAVLFLTGDDCPLWLEACGAPNLDGLEFVTSGKIRRVRAGYGKENRRA